VVALKSALREPESAQFEKIRVDEAGKIVCITYGARNRFGGMSWDHAVLLDGVASLPQWANGISH